MGVASIQEATAILFVAAVAGASASASLLGCSDVEAPASGAAGQRAAPSPELFVSVANLGVTAPSDDPLASHRPALVDCSPLTGWFVEGAELEVNTGECNYFAGSGQAQQAARPGDRLVAEISHFDLTAPAPSSAHLALWVQNEVLWETNVPIPSHANVLTVEIALDRAIDRGATVGLHLHNHGQNSWSVSDIQLWRN